MMSWVLKISIPALVFVFTSPAMAYGNCDSFMNSMSDECKENRRIEARIKILQERARKRKLRRNKKSYKKASHKPYRYSNNSRRTSNKIAPKHYQLKNWNVRTQPSLRRSQVIETAGQRDYKLMTKKLANGKKALITSSNGVWYALTCSTCDEPVWINRKALIRKEAPPARQRETFVDDHKPIVTAKKQPIHKASEKKKPNSRSVKIHKPKKVAEKKKDSVDSFINDIASEAAFDLGFGEAKNPTKKDKKPIAKKEMVEKKATQASLSKVEKAQKKFNELKSKAYKAEIAALAAEKQAEKVKNSNLAPTAKREATQKRLAAQKAAKEMSNANKELLKEASKKKGLSRGLLANTKKHSKAKQLASPKKMKTVGQAKKNFKQFKDKAYHAKLAEVEAQDQAKKMKSISDKAAQELKSKEKNLLADIEKAKNQHKKAKTKAFKATLDLEKALTDSKKKGSRPNNKIASKAKKELPQKKEAVKQAEVEMNKISAQLNKLKKERKALQSKAKQTKLAADKAGKKAKESTDNYNASEKEMNVAYKGLLHAEKEEEKRKALAEQKRLAQEAKEKEKQDALAQQKADEKAKQDALAKEKAKALADKKAKEKKEQELADKKAKEKAKKEALAKKKEEEKKKKELAEKKKEKSFEEKHKRKAFCVKNDKQLRNSPLWEKLGKQSPYGTTWSGVGSHWWVGNITIRMTFNKNGRYTGRGTDDSGKVRGSDRGILQVCYRGGRLYTHSRSLSTGEISKKNIKPGQRVFTLDHDKLGPIQMTKVSR